jgi:hypothetical protein
MTEGSLGQTIGYVSMEKKMLVLGAFWGHPIGKLKSQTYQMNADLEIIVGHVTS